MKTGVRVTAITLGVGTDGVKKDELRGRLDRDCAGGPGAEDTPSCPWDPSSNTQWSIRMAGLGWGPSWPPQENR